MRETNQTLKASLVYTVPGQQSHVVRAYPKKTDSANECLRAWIVPVGGVKVVRGSYSAQTLKHDLYISIGFWVKENHTSVDFKRKSLR